MKKEEKNVEVNPQKKKLSPYEKRKQKLDKQNRLLNSRGIHKFWTTFIVEIIFIFLVEILFKILFGSFAFDYSLLRIFISTSLISFLISIITNNLPLKLRRTLLIIINAFIVIYAWLQLGFMNFLGAFISLGNAEQGTKVMNYITEFIYSFKPVLHLIFIPFILFILYIIFERNITKDGFNKKIPFKNILIDLSGIVFIALLSLGYYVTINAEVMQNKFQTISNKELFKYPSSPSLAIKNFGTTIYFMLDIKGTIFGIEDTTIKYTSQEEAIIQDNSREIDDEAWLSLIETEENETLNSLNNYFINRDISEKNDYTGLFAGKNLIMVMLESVSEVVFQDSYSEYFPTLHKLYTEGITGVNNYSPRNNCATGESELTSQIGLYSIETTCTINTYKKNEYPESLLYMLRKNGYYTSSYHDYTDQYYSRSIIEYNLGSYKYYGVSDLGMSYSSLYKEWPSDEEFIKKALPNFIDQTQFASYMITVTSHMPYIYSSEYGNMYMSEFDDLDISTTAKRYLSKVKVVDMAMEELIKELDESGKLDDTVIVIFGDHYPYGLSTKDYQSLADFDISVNQEVDRTPFIIYNSETSGEKITKITTPLDYTPTLLNLFGIDFDPRLYLGHDIFSDYTDYAVFPDDSWQSEFGFYDATKTEFYPSDEDTIYADQDIIDINNEISEMRNMSALAIKKNYFKYLFDYFDTYEELEVGDNTSSDIDLESETKMEE